MGEEPGLKGIPPNQLFDEIIATLLLHDMIKNGKGLNAQGYPLDRGVTGTHGVTLVTKIFDDGFDSIISEEWKERIYYGIAGHMGIWTTDVGFRPNSLINPVFKAFTNLIHLADYCASRKVDEIYSKLQGEQNGTTKIQKETPPCPGIRETESQATTEADNQ